MRKAWALLVASALAACVAPPAVDDARRPPPTPPPSTSDAPPAPSPPPPAAAPPLPAATLRNAFVEPGLQAFAATAARQAQAMPDTVWLDDRRARAQVALTFDDGPDDVGCPAVARVLAARGVTATFFLLGEEVARRPAAALALADAGHELALHGWSHRSMRAMAPTRAFATHVERARTALRAAVGDRFVETLFRPPYGDATDDQLHLLAARGVRVPLWSIDSLDWRPGATAETIVATTVSLLHPGAIVLMHCGRGHGEATAAALPALLDELHARGLAPVTVGRLLAP
ncbi:MAG: polysaccharide deacetylase family protein [Kofleriaceae bacterium]